MVGLVDGRFPARGRREQLGVPDALLRGTFPAGDAQVQEERRLFYVGMTRARDELVLSHALDYGGKRTRPRVAVRPRGARPSGGCRAADDARQRAGAPGRLRRAAAAAPTAPTPAPTEPLVLSFYQVDAYLTCPLRYSTRTCCGCRRRPTTHRVWVRVAPRRAGVPQAHARAC